MCRSKCLLKIESFNVNGNLYDKFLSIKELDNMVRNFDIFCFQKTWLTKELSFNVKGYKVFRSDRPKKSTVRRASGGVIILFKDNLEPALEIINSKSNNILWVKLKKDFFGLARDTYLANCYIPPYQSSVSRSNDHYSILTEELILNSGRGDVIICGDLNSRIG